MLQGARDDASFEFSIDARDEPNSMSMSGAMISNKVEEQWKAEKAKISSIYNQPHALSRYNL